MTELLKCPHCGSDLHPDERVTYNFSFWATPLVMVILSLMLVAFDLVDNGQQGSFSQRITWSPWAILGIWILFISVQLIRYQPYYEWLMIPVSGILFSIFLAGIDRRTGTNSGFARLDWAWFAIIPIITFLVIMPIAARLVRSQPTQYDRLSYLVDHLVEEQS